MEPPVRIDRIFGRDGGQDARPPPQELTVVLEEQTGRVAERPEAVEREPGPPERGGQSGAFGWFGLDGAVDLSIVLAGRTARIGTGGAITVLSDPEAEYEEMLVKARPLLEVLGCRSTQGGGRIGAII